MSTDNAACACMFGKNSFQRTLQNSNAHVKMTCRVGAFMLAAVMAGLLPDAKASTLNTTDDGLSVAGIFFAKVETFHAKLMSGDIGLVR
jgi:hypothetical protein